MSYQYSAPSQVQITTPACGSTNISSPTISWTSVPVPSSAAYAVYYLYIGSSPDNMKIFYGPTPNTTGDMSAAMANTGVKYARVDAVYWQSGVVASPTTTGAVCSFTTTTLNIVLTAQQQKEIQQGNQDYIDWIINIYNPATQPYPVYYGIKGTVTLNGQPLSGVVINTGIQSAEMSSKLATTDANGNYEYEGLAFCSSDGTIQIWPTLAGYTFNPSLVKLHRQEGNDWYIVNFTAQSTSQTNSNSGSSNTGTSSATYASSAKPTGSSKTSLLVPLALVGVGLVAFYFIMKKHK